MAAQTILVIEDNFQHVKSIFQFIGGSAFEKSIVDKYPDFRDEYPLGLKRVELELTSMSSGRLGEALGNISGEDSYLNVVAVGSKTEADNFLQNEGAADDLLLSFLDLNIVNAEFVEVGVGEQKETAQIALSVFERLLEMQTPVLILSSYLKQAVFEKLQQVANGRFFGFYPKTAFFEAMTSDGNAPQAEANFIASLIFTKPFYNTLLHLKYHFKHDFRGGRAIADELAALLNKRSPSGRRKGPGQYQEEVRSIQEDLRREEPPSPMGVPDEVSTLQALLLHRPGLETQLVNPKNSEDLLFNQPVNPAKFVGQYKRFEAILRGAAQHYGTRIYTVRGLLRQLLDHPQHRDFLRAKFIVELLKGDESPEKFWQLLSLDTEQLIEVAITGTTGARGGQDAFFDPVANFMFTRDWGFTVHNTVFLSNMSKRARVREKVIAKFIFEFHPFFQNVYNAKHSSLGSGTIEGGDVLLVSPQTVVVGLSERTDFEAVQEFARLVFGNIPTVKTLIATPAPREHPKSMHLDTFMGFLDAQTALLYEDILMTKVNPHFVFRGADRIELNVGKFVDLLRQVMKEDGLDLHAIPVSDSNEQYDDACNVFAIAPGKALIYERVHNTIEVIQREGWEVVDLDVEEDADGDLVLTSQSQARLTELLSDPARKVLITVPGDELSLARGGPHCMTFPLNRSGGA